MLVFTDKGKLKKRIKELEETIRESALDEASLRKQVKRLESDLTSMDYRHEADEERWSEKLESYEESLKRRDLTISAMELLHKQLEEQIESLEEELEKASEGSVAMLSDLRLAESAYESLNELLQKVTESLWESGERLWELEEENSRLREELHDAMMEIERLKKESKSPYPTAVINVDVRDTLTKQLAKSLKQVNEAFEKRYKKKYVFTQNGTSDHYECSTLDELLNELRITYWIKEADIYNIREEYESLEEIFNKEGKAYTTLSFFSIEYNSRINITAAIIKEEI